MQMKPLSRNVTSHRWCTYTKGDLAPLIAMFAPPRDMGFNPHGIYANEGGYQGERYYTPMFARFTPNYVVKNPWDHV